MAAVMIFGSIIYIVIKAIQEAAQPKYPAFRDYEASEQHSKDYNQFGREYADRKWRNGDYS